MTQITFKIPINRPGRRPASTPKPKVRQPRSPDRLARQLALAHHIERLIDSGDLRDYSHAAQVLGVTRARLSQIMDLLGLAVEKQEAILVGQGGGSERSIRSTVASFTEQISARKP